MRLLTTLKTLRENTDPTFLMKKCYIFVKFSGKSAKRLYSGFKFLHTSSHILHKTQRTQAILSGIKGFFLVVLPQVSISEVNDEI